MSARSLLVAGLLCLLLVSLAPAQDFRATLTGVVTDPSGAAIPGATVKAVHVETNTTKEAQTTAAGVYTIPYLNPGAYNVEVTASGFQALRRENIVLEVAGKLNLPLKLAVGQVTESITVVGQQEVIESASADRGLVFDPIKTQQYPLNGRQTYMLMSLTPGVIFTQEQFGPSGFSGTRGWDVNSSYTINGARSGQNLFLLNGAPISDPGGSWQLAPNVEAVQEFKVMTNTYDAGYGRFGGGVVNTTLKAGTNDWHGDVFEYWRNSIFDANYFQNNANPDAATGLAKPKGMHNQHQFGGVVGGPVRKNKDFVFGSFEGWQEVIPFVALSSTPPAILRDGQHFTDLGYKVFDPITTHVCDSRTENCQGQVYIRNQFPNNQIPLARISPIGKKILSYYPAPNAPGITNNFVANSNKGRYYYEQPMARWDHVFSDKDKFYAMYTWQQGFENRDSTGFGAPAGNGNNRNQRHDQNAILDWTHVVSATSVLDVRGSFGRFVQTTPGYSDMSLSAVKDLGMTQMIHAPNYSFDVAPRVAVGGYNTIFSSGAVMSWSPRNQWNFAPSLTLSRGKHTLRAGFELNYYAQGNISTGYSNGYFTFASGLTQMLPARTQAGGYDGSGVATLLLGAPTAGQIDFNDSTYRSRPYYAGYVQDDWKVNSRLTLNLGLRYDVQLAWLDRYNRYNRGFDPNVKNPLSDQVLAVWAAAKAAYDKANPTAKYPYPAPPAMLTGSILFPGKGGQPSRLYDTDWTNLAPRLGVAYRIREKTVLRTGGGVFYMSPSITGNSYGFSQSTPYTTSLDGGITPSAGLTGPYSLVNPFPNGMFVPPGASGGALTAIGNGSIDFYPPHGKNPRTYQASFGIQHQLPRNIVAEVSYAGNFQRFIPTGYNMNAQGMANQLQAIADPAYYTRTLQNPFYGILPTTISLGSSNTVNASTLLRPDPLFNGSITNNLIQQGWYRSDALQVRIEQKAFTSGTAGVLTWVLAYTFSKKLQADHRLNNWNTAEPLVKEIDDLDKPQNLAFSGVYDLPMGKNRKLFNGPIASKIAGNWRFDWIFTYVSGYPVGWAQLWTAPNAAGCDNPNGWHALKQDEYHWFNNNKSCYTQPNTNALTTFPDRFPDIRQPQKPQLNVAFEKTIGITERYKVSIRGEAFNLTNTPIRPGPSTSYTSVNFGILPTSQNNWPRICQIAAKFYF